MTQSYLFSIIMAAYNAEAYLPEAIESLQQQTLDFAHIQLILVDDGSTDNTLTLAHTLAKGHPNIQILHQEHSGVSSARNTGLAHIQGSYVNFMDADDKVSPETLENVYAFFQAHEEDTDVVVIPTMLFGDPDGEHPLNYYKKHTGIADLEEHPDHIVTSVSSAYVRYAAAQKMRFDPRLSFGEGARAILPLLLEKRKLGIVSEATYFQRFHENNRIFLEPDIVQPNEWYQPYIDYYCKDIVDYCISQYGNVPALVQHTLAYDLQLRLRTEHLPLSVMDEQEKDRYFAAIIEIYTHIDDTIILAQKGTFADHKLFILQNKYQRLPEQIQKKNNIQLYYGDQKVHNLNRSLVTVDFITISGNTCCIEGALTCFPSIMPEVQPFLLVNGEQYPCQTTDHIRERYSLDHLVMRRQGFICKFALPDSAKPVKIQLAFMFSDVCIIVRKYRFENFVPLDTTFSNAYGVIGNYILQYKKEAILLEKASPGKISQKETAFLDEVRASGIFSEEDILLRKKARAHRIGRPIWLISDRNEQADDNGEAFFAYMCEHHRFSVKSYFVLSRDSKDYERLSKIGPVISDGTPEHKLLYLQSQFVVSSQANEVNMSPLRAQNALYKDLTAQKPFIFLQHGVIKDDLSGWLNRYNKNLRGFITTAKPEFLSICTPSYGYTDREVWLTGLARHDRLYNDPQKMITIMPTWRRNLMDNYSADGHWIPLPGLENSEYVSFYRELFQNSRLQETAKRLGYTLAFKPHPNSMDFIPCFALPANVNVLDQSVTYRDTFAKSDLVLTDYSSVVFDFAYLRKPIVYYQGDRESFFEGHTYTEGYYDYERDGFGEVTYTLEETVDLLISYMEDGCKLKDKYRDRMDQFFPFHDQNCCKRTYDKIRAIK